MHSQHREDHVQEYTQGNTLFLAPNMKKQRPLEKFLYMYYKISKKNIAKIV